MNLSFWGPPSFTGVVGTKREVGERNAGPSPGSLPASLCSRIAAGYDERGYQVMGQTNKTTDKNQDIERERVQ